jgi:hypothetical protein
LSNAKRTTERQEETRLKVINTLAFNPEKFCNLVALKDEKELTRFSVGLTHTIGEWGTGNRIPGVVAILD